MTIARDLANVASLMASSSANVVFDDSIVITGGTANSVLYLSTSKLATSNSGFTFNGTTLTAPAFSGSVQPRIVTIASSASITPNANTTDQYNVTALATNATFNAPSGTPVDGQKLVIRVKDNGVARTLSWANTSGAYREVGSTLPTTTAANTSVVYYIGCIYNSQDTYWDVVAVTNN